MHVVRGCPSKEKLPKGKSKLPNQAKTKKYQLICKTSVKSNERNDCAVKAVAMAGRVTYPVALKLCAEMGRKSNKGLSTYNIHRAFAKLGFDVEEVPNLVQKNGSQYTPKTIGKKLKSGYFVAYVNGHVLPVINGEVFDWSKNRQHRIFSAYKVVRKQS